MTDVLRDKVQAVSASADVKAKRKAKDLTEHLYDSHRIVEQCPACAQAAQASK